MSTKSPSELEADETAQKRAQWEQFSFDVDALGTVEVTNESHENPAAHQYVVTVDDATDDGTLDAFPCWPCVRTGRTELPNEPPLQPFVSMTRQVTFSEITDQRTLTESAKAVADNTPETPTALLDLCF